MDSKFLRADELGIRLEIVAGLPIWEPHPFYRHQKAIDRIRATIGKDLSSTNPHAIRCECINISNVYVSFPDGSLKRPDIAIFCEEPREEDEAITLVPEAVIGIVSKGYEAKDLEIGPHFYLSQGVKDVVVFDPYTLLVLHVRRDGTTRQISPVEIVLECGCTCTVWSAYFSCTSSVQDARMFSLTQKLLHPFCRYQISSVAMITCWILARC